LETVKTIAAKGADINAFPLAEADYLLRLADAKLKMERNVPAARLALDAAQQRLKTVKEAGLAPVQTMLGEAIASLRGVQLPDITAISHKLMAMETPIDSLPLQLDSGVPDIRERIKPATTVSLSADADRSWWDRSIEAVWNQFKEIVVIRRQRIEAPPLIARENEFFLRQNLRLELEGMRLALLRGDAEAYQASYQMVHDWTQTYFDVADPKVAQFLAELQALQAVQFNPYIPDLTGLRRAFQEFMTQRQPIRTLRPASATPPAAAEPAESAESTAPAVTEEAQP
jgi:uroporphyrin-3 C-methyltransferase